MKEGILYYTAGIIDGEGTITLSTKKSKTGNTDFRQPVISVSSTTPEILEFLKSNFGGYISKHKVYQDHHKESFSWKIIYSDAISLCKLIHPYLLEPEKKRRALLIANEYPKVTKRNGKYTNKELQRKLLFQENFFSS